MTRRRRRGLQSGGRRRQPKVFCIGFHKTGTTSLTVALRELGYSLTGRQRLKYVTRWGDLWLAAVRIAKDLQVFQDNPWPIYCEELDRLLPGSNFILTLRDSQSWIRSQFLRFGEKDSRMRRWIYGVGHPEGNEPLYVSRY
jgi:hypothetical protein